MEKLSRALLVILRVFGLIAASVFIGYLNFLVIRGWFGGWGPANLGSIEVSYVSMGRFLVDFGWKTWAPFWYLGFPFYLFYTPLLPVMEMILHNRLGMHLWESYRAVTGWAYILGPVSVFIMGWALSKKWIGGLVSGILYSVAPTLFYYILPRTLESKYGELAADRISFEFWEPRRFTVLVKWGEGPHTISLMLLPLAGACYAIYLRKKRFLFAVLTAIFFMLASLSNALGFMGCILLMGSISFSYYAKAKNKGKILKAMLASVVLGMGLLSFWYNLSFISNFFSEGGGVMGMYLSMFPWGWLAILLGLSVLYFAIKKFIPDRGLGAALVWFSGLFSVVYYYYISAPAELSERRIELLPQALRYITQADMALSVLLGVFVAGAVKLVGKKFVIGEIILTIFLSIGVLYSYVYIQPLLDDSYAASSNIVDVSSKSERVIAEWLDNNIDTAKGERVFIPGNYGFYLNWFTDVWQHRGGLFQATTHEWPAHIHYQMAVGDDWEISDAWLRVMNAKFTVLTASGSAELYKEMKHFERFEKYEEAARFGGDIIYKVPLKNPSTAKVVNEIEGQVLVAPRKADDKPALMAYIDWLENSSENKLSFEMIDHDNYKITGTVDEGEGVLVQMTADSGWSARDLLRSKRVKTGADILGFLMLYPEAGEVNLELTHGRVWQEWFGYLISIGTVFFILYYGFAVRRFRKEETVNEER